ncbi:MAG TPA: sensor domain-containing protein [Gammaproteobacteria bacterium]
MTERLPRSVQEYLDQLREALRDADPALRQDALYDAEEYLRAELNGRSDQPESEVIARIVRSYGAPEEVAEVYRQTEETVARAMRTPPPRERRSLPGRFFGVYADPRAYSSLFYMVLALATGIFYFTWTVAGISVSLGTLILIFGFPIFLLFLGSTRLFSLLEGRIVETFLGVRMPRRPEYPLRDRGILARIGEMLKDVRTWSTLLYMLLMLPLGIAYFTLAVSLVTTSLALFFSPLAYLVADGWIRADIGYFHFNGSHYDLSGWEFVIVPLCGLLMLTVSMHLFRGIGLLQGRIARGLLVLPGRD